MNNKKLYKGIHMGHSDEWREKREKEKYFWKWGWGIIGVVCVLGVYSWYMALSGNW